MLISTLGYMEVSHSFAFTNKFFNLILKLHRKFTWDLVLECISVISIIKEQHVINVNSLDHWASLVECSFNYTAQILSAGNILHSFKFYAGDAFLRPFMLACVLRTFVFPSFHEYSPRPQTKAFFATPFFELYPGEPQRVLIILSSVFCSVGIYLLVFVFAFQKFSFTNSALGFSLSFVTNDNPSRNTCFS